MSEEKQEVVVENDVPSPPVVVVEEKITSTSPPPKKEKDPRKVEAGKRLAAISKAAKERKMREKIESENQIDFSINFASLFYFGIPSILLGAMYLWASTRKVDDPHPMTTKVALPKRRDEDEGTSLKKTNNNFVSLFD